MHAINPHLDPIESAAATSSPSGNVLLYDGVCGMCQATVRWLMRHDPAGRLRFAAQQWSAAQAVLARHEVDHAQLNSAVLVTDFGGPTEALALRSDAILGSLVVLGGFWKLVAQLGRLVPLPMRNAVYGWVARNRLRFFGTAELCALPTPAERARFLES